MVLGCKALWCSKKVTHSHSYQCTFCSCQAVCCEDHLHCCPHGTVCNLEAETCDDPSGFLASLPWVAKVSALTSEAQDEKCDTQTMCPGGTTCCKKGSGQWACCPLPQVSHCRSDDAGVFGRTDGRGCVCSCRVSTVIELWSGRRYYRLPGCESMAHFHVDNVRKTLFKKVKDTRSLWT